MSPEAWTFLGLLVTGLGARELLSFLVKRRAEQVDARTAAAAARAQERAEAEDRALVERAEGHRIDAEDKSELLEQLLQELRERISGYRGDIERLTQRHDQELSRQARLIEALQEDNRSLGRKVEKLQELVQEYRVGARVPRGMVLVPLVHVRQLRIAHPDLLPSPWYQGEDEDPASGGGPRSIVAEITPLRPGNGGGSHE